MKVKVNIELVNMFIYVMHIFYVYNEILKSCKHERKVIVTTFDEKSFI